MYHEQTHQLIEFAREKMLQSRDHVHDLRHAERVVYFAKMICSDMNVDPANKEIMTLSAWWHDVGRTVNRKPSLIIMSFFDDIVSAFLLMFHALRMRLFTPHVWLAVRIIVSKSLGTGALFTKLLLSKKNRYLVDILEDADSLDVFEIERFEQVRPLVELSMRYRYGYKILIRWWLMQSHIYLKTKAAQKYIVEIFERLIEWVLQPHIKLWHIEQYGIEWVEKTIRRFNLVVHELRLLVLLPA